MPASLSPKWSQPKVWLNRAESHPTDHRLQGLSPSVAQYTRDRLLQDDLNDWLKANPKTGSDEDDDQAELL